jgi:hypothetical protein
MMTKFSSDVHDPSLLEQSISDEEVARRLAASFGDLSMDEREKALHDIHGVGDGVEETPEVVATSLEKLVKEVNLIPDKKAFETAYSQSPEFVCDPELHMQFLRAERFDVKKAAERMVYHFEKKLELFGSDSLGREIRLSDLNEKDMVGFRSGYLRMLPLRDQAGRLVVFYAKSLFPPTMTIVERVRSINHQYCTMPDTCDF